MRWLLIPVLALAAAKSCGPQTVKGPPTKDCPKGEWIVERDEAAQTVSVTCKEPAVVESPTPSTSPSPGPVASPTPGTPSASPTPTPKPSTLPSGPDLCPKPSRAKLAIFAKRKLEPSRHTWRNVWNVTPMVPSTGNNGSCEWKRNQETGELPSECEAMPQCVPVYRKLFAPIDPAVGIPQAFQDGTGFKHDSVERSSENDYLLVITDGAAGSSRLCASFPNLDSWRCQDFFIDAEGEAVGVNGNDSTRSFDLPK